MNLRQISSVIIAIIIVIGICLLGIDMQNERDEHRDKLNEFCKSKGYEGAQGSNSIGQYNCYKYVDGFKEISKPIDNREVQIR